VLEAAEQIVETYLALKGLPDDSPSRRLDEERRAIFAASYEKSAHRPTCRTNRFNLRVPGDYVRTELRATVERVSHRAMRLTFDRRGAS